MINVKYSGVMIMGLDKVRKKKKNKMRNRYIYRASILLVLVAAIIYTLMTNLTGEKVTRQDIGDEAHNFELVQVNLDQSELKVDQFIEEFNLTFPVPHDVRDEVRELYGIGPLPSTVFINPEGIIDDVVIGALTLDRLEAQLNNIQPK